MGRGSDRLHTVWLPWHDVPIERGGLAVLAGSHALPGFDSVRKTYGQHDTGFSDIVDAGGWGSDSLELERFDAGSEWVTADYRAGDLLCVPSQSRAEHSARSPSSTLSSRVVSASFSCCFLVHETRPALLLCSRATLIPGRGVRRIFKMHTMHAAVTNTTTDPLRISADIRFQPASEPVDNRYTASGPEWADTPSVGLTNLAVASGLYVCQRFQRQSCAAGQDAQLEFQELYGRGSWGAERRTRTMEQAKRDWGLLPPPRGQGGKL